MPKIMGIALRGGIWAICAAAVLGQQVQRDPHIGYLYPAGGRQGAVVQVVAGGQFLYGVTRVVVSGKGVQAILLRQVPGLKFGDKKLQEELQARLKAAREAAGGAQNLASPRAAPIPARVKAEPTPAPGVTLAMASPQMTEPTPVMSPGSVQMSAAPPMMHTTGRADGIAPPGVYKPPPTEDSLEAAVLAFPMARELDRLSFKELQYVAKEFRKPNRRQLNAQIAELVILQFKIDRDATPGDRDVRLLTGLGLTNPIHFQVGRLPEILEREPNNPDSPEIPRISPPVLVNGQIMPGDVDCFRFRARKGRRLVAQVQARHLIPYLADAVPGWFQATLALYDSAGTEVAYADDCGFDPDPVLVFDVPREDDYTIEIKDALYRGRQDFVYRLSVEGEASPVEPSHVVGGGAGAGGGAEAGPGGVQAPRWGPWDLVDPRHRIGAQVTRQEVWARTDVRPTCQEIEPNDTPESAQRLTLPAVVSGSIQRPGDVDCFRFGGRAGEEVVVEVTARRMGSPLDSLVRLSDASGKVLAWNDDYKEVDAGLLTHHADSYLMTTLPQDGDYTVRLSDAQHHGGDSYTYLLRISHPIPDFAVFVSPATVNMPPTPAFVLNVRAVRRDGFAGDIDLALVGPTQGFTLSGARVPHGRDTVRMTLTAPAEPPDEPIVLRFEARAQMGGQWSRRMVIPAEDVMQAFLYRHLVPTPDFMVWSRSNWRLGPLVQRSGPTPVRIPAGGVTEVLFKVAQSPLLRELELALGDPPKGMTLESIGHVPEGLLLRVRAGPKEPPVGYADNLIVETFWEKPAVPATDTQPAKPKERISRGVLPAIPFEIVSP